MKTELPDRELFVTRKFISYGIPISNSLILYVNVQLISVSSAGHS
jgi:hypothetical protein